MRANIAELVESAFEEALHPRDRGGKWAAKIGAMKLGGRLRVGGSHVDKVTVAPPFTVPGLNKAAGWKPGMVRHKVTGGGREPSYHESAGDAAVELEKRLGSGGAPDPPATDFEATMRGLSATSSGPEPSPRRREGLLRTRTAAERASRGKPLDENERAALDWWHREGKQGLNDQERSYLQGFQIMGPGVGTRAMLGGTVPHPSSVARAARPAVDDLARRALEYTPPEVVERARRAVPRSRSTRPRELPGPAEQAAKANRAARERAARGMKFTKPAIREAVMDEMTAVVLEASISRAERDKAAKEGKALPDGSYPIRNARELSAAVTLARSGHGNVAAAKRHIAKRAKALGVKSPLQESTLDGAIAEMLAGLDGEPEFEPVREAADSMAKASTPEPFSRSKTSNWVARAGGLPPYVQHIAHDIMEKRGKTESQAIQIAIGVVKNPPASWGAEAKAACAKAAAEWEAKKGASKAKAAVKEAEVVIEEADYEVARASAHPTLQELVEGAFDEALHPRDRRGEFASILGKLPVGSSTSLGLKSGVFVKRTGANQWRVNKRTGAPGPNKPKGQGLPFNSAQSAAGHALSLHEQHFRANPGDLPTPKAPKPDSLGHARPTGTDAFLSEKVTVGGLPTTRGEAWKQAHDAAVTRGHPNPRASADRFMQGLDRSNPRLPGAPHPADVAARAATARKAAKLPSPAQRKANESAASLRNGHRDKGEAKMTAVLSGVNGHQVHRHNDGTAHTVDPQGHVAEHENEADARKYANHNEPTTAASKPLGLGKTPRYSVRNDAALASGNQATSARSHWDNQPDEPGVVGSRMLGQSVQKNGKVHAAYYRANGSLRTLGPFSSHEEAHKALIKAHEGARRRKPKTQEAGMAHDYGQLVAAAIEEAATAASEGGSDAKGTGSKASVFCVKDRKKVVPTAKGTCPECGMRLPKPKVSEAEEAVREALSA